MTKSNALLRASDGLCTALQNAAPESKAMETEVNALVEIFSGKANSERIVTDAKRKMREAQKRRADSKAAEAATQRVPDRESNPD